MKRLENFMFYMTNVFAIFGAVFMIVFLNSVVFGATVSLDETRQNAKDQTVFFTVTHEGVDYEYSADIPLLSDSQIHIQSQTDEYMAHIYREMYRRAPRNLRSISQWETWIADGSIITLPNGKTKVIKKKPFSGKHPAWIQLKIDIDAATTIADLKIIIKKMLGD